MTHPITPSRELLQQWAVEYWGNPGESIGEGEKHIAIQAARWGADQELEACCEWFAQDWSDTETAAALRATRRPKPPSLKQQAIEALQRAEEGWRPIPEDCDIIRRALEQLDD